MHAGDRGPHVLEAAGLLDTPAVSPVPVALGPRTAAGQRRRQTPSTTQPVTLVLPAALHAVSAVGLYVVTVSPGNVAGSLEVHLLCWVPLPFAALFDGWLVLLLGDGGLA